MSAPFASPHLLAAFAGHSDGGDPELQQGPHFRLMPSPGIGFPLGPFALWAAEPGRIHPEVVWTDRHGFVVEGPDLDEHENELHGYLVPPEDGIYVAVELSNSFDPSELALIDEIAPGSSRVVAVRSEAPWTIAGPGLGHIRVRGRGFIEPIAVFWLSSEHLLGTLGNPAVRPELLGLPLADPLPWYASPQGQEAALERVERGSPQSLGPPDEPDGPPFAGLHPSDERERIEAIAPEIDRRLVEMLGDPDLPPWLHRDRAASREGRAEHRTKLKTAAALGAQSLDPGIGRYLGLVTMPESGGGAELGCWVAAGVFAFEPGQVLPDGRTAEAAFGSDRFLDRILLHLFGETPELERIAAAQIERGYLVRVLLTAAAAPAMPDRPPPPRLAVASSQWLQDGGPDDQRFRQQLRVEEAPLAPLVAFARRGEEGWRSLHQQLELPGGGSRATALLLGKGAGGAGILADAPVPEREGCRYRVRLGDLFGRYGAAEEIDAAPPPHPPPVRPTPKSEVVRAGGLPAGERASPGTLIVRVPVPLPEQATPGSRPIVAVRAVLGGVEEEVAPVAPVTEIALPLAALEPGGELRQTLKVGFRDDRGADSDLAREPVRVLDGRAPLPLRSGIGITWSSRPGPSEEVELRLSWDGRGKERYRVYIADAQALGVPVEDRTRAEIAEAASNMKGVDGRRFFRLLTDPPLEPKEDRVVLDARLPRSLQTVQMLRVVPLSAGNVEAPFAQCPLVPIAVPSERRPPPPRLTATVDPESGRAQLLVSAPGLNEEQLRRAEPGLFEDPPGAEAQPPEYRLRRAIGHLVEPVYARRRATGKLRRGAEEGQPEVFAALVEEGGEPGLEPYVRCVYWAEVRMPAERRLPPGVHEPGGLLSAEPAQMADVPGLFSEPSPHAYAMRVPAEVPAIAAGQVRLQANSDGAGRVSLEVGIDGGPSAHDSAVGSYRLRAWVRQGSGPIVRLGSDETMPTIAGGLEWASDHFAVTDPAAALLGVLLAIVDPLDRQGPVLELTAGLGINER